MVCVAYRPLCGPAKRLLSSGLLYDVEGALGPQSLRKLIARDRLLSTGAYSDKPQKTDSDSATTLPIQDGCDEQKKIVKRYVRKSSPVPKSRASRLWHLGNLAANIGLNVLVESVKRNVGYKDKNDDGEDSGIIQDNLVIIVQKFAKLRGAALKVAQLLCMHGVLGSNGDEILDTLQNAQHNAHSMSDSQLESVLTSSTGPDWNKRLKYFNKIPFAAASIGQVHLAETCQGEKVAVKIQYPGVDQSIDSDIRNILGIFSMVKILPKGLFLENILENIRTEFVNECDYNKELKNLKIFAEKLAPYTEFSTPEVYEELSSKRVLTTKLVEGLAFSKCFDLPQEDRDYICQSLFKLCLLELFVFNIMQTDPNWSNFIYNSHTKKITLIDFGACSSFNSEFIKLYARLLIAASRRNIDDCMCYSMKLGYLTGNESKTMIDAHIESILNIARPFWFDGPEIFDFSNQKIIQEVLKKISIIFEERLTPPPSDTYSLHRKLTGVLLLCSKLGSRVHCKELINSYAYPAAQLNENKSCYWM